MIGLLNVENVSVNFGGVHALKNVSFGVNKGELLCLIGPNGAGKTTLLRSIIGVVTTAKDANIRLSGRSISNLPTHKRARLGLALTHQIVRPFISMTLLDNVSLAAGHRRLQNVIGALFCVNRQKERARAHELLDLVGIADQAERPVSGQPLGVLKRLEVARALALDPQVIFMDEPLAGLNHIEAGRLADTVVEINRQGLTVVMIEHNLGEVLRVAQRLVVLDNGVKIADGTPEKVMQSEMVRTAYIGKAGNNATT